MQLDVSRSRHLLDARKGFEPAEKNSSGLPLGFARHVKAIMIAVDEVNIGVSGRTEQDCSAGSVAGGGVGRGIIFSEISLNFDDAGSQAQLSVVPHQHFAKKFSSHAPRIAGEEGAREWANGAQCARVGQGHGKSEVRGQNPEVKPEVRTRIRLKF